MKKVEDRKDWASTLENLATDKLPEVLTKAEEDHKLFTNELKSQLAGYSFSCKRHGDFLTLFIAQKNNKGGEYPHYHTKYSTTLNLSSIKTLRMEEGSGVTRDFVVGFGWEIDFIDGGGCRVFPQTLRNPKENEHYVVAPEYPYMNPGRLLFIENQSNTGGGGNHYNQTDHIIRFQVPNYPSSYDPDKIYFDGTGTLEIPYGKGNEVYQAILEELATWDGPPAVERG